MTHLFRNHALLSPSERFAAALAALTASVSIAGALILAFAGVSPSLWLAPTPELSEQLAQCEHLAARPAREQCKRDLVTAYLEAHKQPVRMTQR